MVEIWHKYGDMSSNIGYLLLFTLKFLMQFFTKLLAGKTGAASMTVMSRVRSSMNDPGKNRSYAKLSICFLPKRVATVNKITIRSSFARDSGLHNSQIRIKFYLHDMSSVIILNSTFSVMK
jgi:hypothetical protein